MLWSIALHRLFIIHIHNGFPQGDGVLLANYILCGSAEEELIRSANRAGVAVGHVHKVIPAADGHNVPHVVAVIHLAADQRAGRPALLILERQIAQVLECLGVALADHIGVGIAIEHVDELPRVAVGVAASRSASIIGHLSFDVLTVRHELLVIGLACVSIDHSLRFFRRVRHRFCLGGVRLKGVV